MKSPSNKMVKNKKGRSYFFPEYQQTVEAESLEKAQKKVKKLKKK